MTNKHIDIELFYIAQILNLDYKSFVKIDKILNEKHFENQKLHSLYKEIRQHFDNFKIAPATNLLDKRFADIMSMVEPIEFDELYAAIAKYTDKRQMEIDVLKAADDLAANKDPVEIRSDLSKRHIPQMNNTRLNTYNENNISIVYDKADRISSGYKCIDAKMNGGFLRGELNIVYGGSGQGKSVFLQNLSLNQSINGHNVLYISLEMSVPACTKRIWAMLTETPLYMPIFAQKDDVQRKLPLVKELAIDRGEHIIQYLPSNSSIDDVDQLISDVEEEEEIKITSVCIDYFDLLGAVRRSDNMFTNDKETSEQLRELAVRRDMLLFTASQLNRQGNEADDVSRNHLGGGLSKLFTGDNVFVIRKREHHSQIFQLEINKTRDTAGLNEIINFHYNTDFLRLTSMMGQLPKEEPINYLTRTTEKKNGVFHKDGNLVAITSKVLSAYWPNKSDLKEYRISYMKSVGFVLSRNKINGVATDWFYLDGESMEELKSLIEEVI